MIRRLMRLTLIAALSLALFWTCTSLISRADPVNTHALGGIRIGMHSYEVKRRLGEPDAVRSLIAISRRQPIVVGEEWVYAGSHAVPAAYIRFRAGRVSDKGRLR